VKDEWAFLDDLIARHAVRIEQLKEMDPTTEIVCEVCGGTAPEPHLCGCDGTQTVAQAIAHHEAEIEILGK
jgi:hypothetical protein